MASIRKRKIGKRMYYYLEHSYKSDGKTNLISRYLGQELPYDASQINALKKDLELEIMRRKWQKELLSIKKNYSKEQRTLPKIAKDKSIEAFMVDFIFNSDRIEGSKLSYKDTANLLVHGSTPKNKPVKDIKEAEGYKNAFYDMLNYKGILTLKKICSWHKMIFENSYPAIADLIRGHKITVTGTRVSFPHHGNINEYLDEFFRWYKNNKKRYLPVEFAALVHLRFVTIHPFTDGNGRISRLLANFVLYNENCPMSNILFGDRAAYYTALEHSQMYDEDKHFLRYFIRRYVKENKEYLG